MSRRFGAHIGGGIAKAPERAAAMGAECVQIFASAPQNWRAPNHKDEVVDAFRQGMADFGLGPTVLHAVYLLNPASLDERIAANTVESIATHLAWADRLDALGLIIHLGCSVGQERQPALELEIRRLREALARHAGPAMLLLENAAGSGAVIGCKLDELGWLVRELDDPRVGICLDTCHAFAAGYDLTTPEGTDRLATELDREIGLPLLRAIHANDSKTPCGSNRDRHDNIGAGHIGADGFRHFLAHPSFATQPLYLEVPGGEGEGPGRDDLNALRACAGAALLPT